MRHRDSTPYPRASRREEVRAHPRTVAAGVALMLVACGAAAALLAQPATPTRPHHPDIPYQSPASLGAASYAKVVCSAVFVSGRDVEEARRNSAYFLMAEPDREEPVTVDVDRPGQARAGHAEGRHAHGGVLRRSGLRHPSRGPRRRPLHADAGAHARCPTPTRHAVADGRCPAGDAVGRAARPRRRERRGRPGVRGSRGPHRRDGRRAQGADRRRALHGRHHQGHAARELVDGQEPDRHARRAGGHARALRARRPRAGARLAPPRRPARGDPHPRRDADVERPQLHRPGRPASGSAHAVPRPLLHLRRRGGRLQVRHRRRRWSSRRASSAAIATPTR